MLMSDDRDHNIMRVILLHVSPTDKISRLFAHYTGTWLAFYNA